MAINFAELLGAELESENPFAGKTDSGEWIEGYVSVSFLQEHFGHLSTATEMQAATESEGLKLYFGWLADQGIIPR